MTRPQAWPVVAGVIATALIWELIGRTQAFGPSWAPLSTVIAWAFTPEHRALLAAGLLQTGSEALMGLLIGSCAGIALASLAVIVPPLAPGLGAFASLVNGIPIIAVAGVCVLTLPRDATPVVVAALAVGFIVFVATSSGLASPLAVQRELFSALGASRFAKFGRLALPSALPALIDGLRSAAPSAVVGAIIGEWFAAERGLGPMLVAAMQNYAIEQLWATALAGALLSIAAYIVLGLLRGAVAARFS
jgi:ABC-type nitrate/sulfonate/bicarbonate transport system permease component